MLTEEEKEEKIDNKTCDLLNNFIWGMRKLGYSDEDSGRKAVQLGMDLLNIDDARCLPLIVGQFSETPKI